jgi:predicted dithiol-disulfide oxidoreductase (DUF899 family)
MPSLHDIRMPGETARYRTARNELLREEIALRREVERVAALRRKLPLGGEIPKDYAFTEAAGRTTRKVKLSQLFARGQDTLIVYSFMYGPRMKRPCPMCTSMLDALDRTAQHLTQRVSLAVVAASPIARVRAFARERGWENLRLLSAEGTTYNRDYHGEDGEANPMPMMNVFVKRGGKVRHSWGTESLWVTPDKGQDPRHVDMFWPLWNLLDVTPGGRGKDWYPSLSYES